MNQQRILEIDIIKGIAMLTVLWHHSFILYPINMFDIPWCQYAMAINGTYFMNVFFLVSGYLFAFSRPRTFIENTKNKLHRLLLPYVSYAIINLGVKYLAPGLVNRKVESIGSYLEAFLFRGGELWFVYVLLIIFLIWPLLLNKRRSVKLWIIIIVLLVADILQNAFVTHGNHLFLYSRVIHYSLFFVGGYAMKMLGRRWLENKWLFILFTVLFILFNCIFVQTINMPYVWPYILAIIGCGFVWMVSYRLTRKASVSKLLSFVGKYSLPYYWLNGFVLVIARSIVTKCLHDYPSVAVVGSIFLLCVIIETLLILIFRKLPKSIGSIIGM